MFADEWYYRLPIPIIKIIIIFNYVLLYRLQNEIII